MYRYSISSILRLLVPKNDQSGNGTFVRKNNKIMLKFLSLYSTVSSRYRYGTFLSKTVLDNFVSGSDVNPEWFIPDHHNTTQCWSKFARAGQQTTIPWQRDLVFRPQNCWLQHYTRYRYLAIFVVGLWLLHLDTEAVTFLESFLVLEALFHCRVVVVAQLKFLSRAQLWFFRNMVSNSQKYSRVQKTPRCHWEWHDARRVEQNMTCAQLCRKISILIKLT